MKQFLPAVLTLVSMIAVGQDKYNYVHYNKLLELKGTDFVIATVENWGKAFSSKAKYLLFIDTKSGQAKQVDFPKDAFIQTVEQVKLDTLGINTVIVIASTVNLDGNKSIDWNDPRQVIVLSTDGRERTQLTEDNYFLTTWTVNSNAGTVVTTGYYDTNNNGKWDKTDKNQILVYDLKTKKLVARI